MELLRPYALVGMLVVPLLLLVLWLRRRKTRPQAFRVSDATLIRAALHQRKSWKRHLPAALFLLGLLGLPIAAARPQTTSRVPIDQTSIVLAMDVSRSMCANDIEPNRLSAAQEAARRFVKDQPSGTKIGLVAFSGFAELIVEPTKERQQLLEAIDNFTTARGTAIGSATLKSIDAIATVNPDVAPVGNDEVDPEAEEDFGRFEARENGDEEIDVDAPPEGTEFIPDIVVLLTDGANSRGVQPLEAAKVAVKRKVRVYTIGFGTEEPADLICAPNQISPFDADFQPGGRFDPSQGAGGGAGGGGGGGGGDTQRFQRFLRVDVPTLQAVSKMTGGQYFQAENADQLVKVFGDLPRRVQLQTRRVEISVVFAALGTLLVSAGIALSMRWNRGF
jgi:Ca-activated chloride channel homolog